MTPSTAPVLPTWSELVEAEIDPVDSEDINYSSEMHIDSHEEMAVPEVSREPYDHIIYSDEEREREAELMREEKEWERAEREMEKREEMERKETERKDMERKEKEEKEKLKRDAETGGRFGLAYATE